MGKLDKLLALLGRTRKQVKLGLFIRSDDVSVLDAIARVSMKTGARAYRVDSWEHDGSWVLHQYRPSGEWDKDHRATNVALLN